MARISSNCSFNNFTLKHSFCMRLAVNQVPSHSPSCMCVCFQLNCCGPTGTVIDSAKETCPPRELLEELITKVGYLACVFLNGCQQTQTAKLRGAE